MSEKTDSRNDRLTPTADKHEVFATTSVRGNTPLTGWPKPPPARREGSSVLSAMNYLVFWKARERHKERKDRFALQRIDLFSLSGHIFIQQPFSDCPARAASACSRLSGRYCVSLTSLETPLSGYPEAPCSRLSGRYCISLMSSETPLTGCPEAPQRLSPYVIQSPYSITAAKLLHPVANR